MPESRPPGPKLTRRRLQVGLAWVLSLALVASYYLVGDGGEEDDRSGAHTVAPKSEDDALDIIDVRESDPTPGSLVEVYYVNGDPTKRDRMRAILSHSTPNGTIKWELEVVQRNKGSLVVRIPKDARPARHKLRVQQGEDEE